MNDGYPAWCDDTYLLELVADATRAGTPSVADVIAAGQALYTWRTVDAELAEWLPTCAPSQRSE